MQTPENTPADRLLGAIAHMAEASGLAYSLVQELAHLQAELTPLIGGPLEPASPADRAYAHVITALPGAFRVTREIAAIAQAFDDALTAADDTPAPELAVVR